MVSKISRLEIKNFLGIEQLELNPSKINILKGKNGQGKTSVLEAIEKALSNNSRRPTVIRTSENEAMLYIELTDGTDIDRRIRNDKADYIKVTKDGKSVTGPEGYLRTLFNNEAFDPTDFLLRSEKEQAEILLELIEINTGEDKIFKWFGEVPQGINYNQHGLKVLKSLESHYYNLRKELNLEIKQLLHEVESLEKQLPDNFNATEWRDVSLKDKFDAITNANAINGYIAQAKILIEGLEDRKKAIEGSYIEKVNEVKGYFESERKQNKEDVERHYEDIKSLRGLIDEQDTILDRKKLEIDYDLEIATQELRNKAARDKANLEKESKNAKDEFNRKIHELSLSINSLESKIENTHDLEKERVSGIDAWKEEQISLAEERVSKASEYLEENQEIDIEPLELEANTAEEMKGYIPLYDRMTSIITGGLDLKLKRKEVLSKKIEKARELPSVLLKKAEKPIEGLGLDDKLQITIHGLPVANLSTSEKIKFAIQVARAKTGELKLINVDKFETLDPDQQQVFLDEIKDDDFQYFIACVTGDSFNVEKKGEK